MIDNIHALAPGFELNHYIIESVLGSGGFGIVYKAHHAHLEELVAIKEFLPTQLAGRHGNTVVPNSTATQEMFGECLRRFMEEGRTLVKLRHPNVVRCRDLFTANGTAYLVMEYEDGFPLDQLARSSEQQLLGFLKPLAEGLVYIHSKGVLHRDIKPANVLLRRSDGSPVIIDFGAAKQNFALVSQSQAPFTEFYAPIEQIEGGGEAKPTLDIHAFGGLMYRLATGQVGPKAESRVMALVFGKPDPLQKISELAKGQYSETFLATIDQCLAIKADDRPQSMTAVISMLPKLLPAKAKPKSTEVKAKKIISREPKSKQAKEAVKKTSLSDLDELIALAGADAVITDSEMGMLLNKASALGIRSDTALQYILQKAADSGWSVSSEKVESQAPKKRKVSAAAPKVTTKRGDYVAADSENIDFKQYIGTLVSISGGSYKMGSNRSILEMPTHEVTVKSFMMMEHPVTFALWDACVAAGGCPHNPRDFGWGRNNRPVVDVSFRDIVSDFIPWLNKATGQTFRLPSEAEWEYAARAGSQTVFSWGNSISYSQARYDGRKNSGSINSGVGTVPVKSYSANAFGLYDMHGNVSEWVEDCWNENYKGAPSRGIAWHLGDCGKHVVRGGAWGNIEEYLTSTFRDKRMTNYRGSDLGFRLVMDI